MERGARSRMTRLHALASRGYTARLRELLQSTGSDCWALDLPNSTDRTPLYMACRGGHTETAQLLLEAGASVDQAKANGVTALHVACHFGHTEVVRLLLDAGAAVEQDSNDGTCLFISCRQGHDKVVRLLLDAGASTSFADPVDGATPLHMACQMQHLGAARLLLEAGAAVDVTANNGLSPMLMACEDGSLPLASLLSSYGATRAGGGDPSERWTAEQVAHRGGHSELLGWLVSSRRWSTPLHHASLLTPDHTRRLLRGGADIHARAHPQEVPSPSPLELAHGVHSGESGFDSAALVIQASGAWSPASHALWPDASRARAVALLRLGVLLSRSTAPPGPFGRAEQGLADVWKERVIPLALGLRSCGG